MRARWNRFKDEEMPKEQYFLTAIAASSSAEDPNLPSAREEAAEKNEKKLEQIEKEYKEWLNATAKEVREMDSTTTGRSINKALLSQERTDNLSSPLYAKEFWNGLGIAIEEAIKKESGAVSYDRASKLAEELLVQHYNATINPSFLQGAVASGEAIMPLGLRAWLVASIDDEALAYEGFVARYRSWSTDIAHVVALCENQLKGRDFTLDKKKLQKELESKLSYSLQGATPGLDLLKQLEKALPEQQRISFDALTQTWQDGVNSIQTDAFVKNLWDNYIAGTTQSSIDEASTSFINKLPSKESFVNALLDSRYYAQKLAAPTQTNPLLAAFIAKRTNDKQGFHFYLEMPLVYQQAKNHQGQLWQHALPSAKKEDYRIKIPDSAGYEIDKSSLMVQRHTTKYLVNENIFTATTGVTFHLNVRDTSGQRVVEKGGAGKFNVMTLDADVLSELSTKLGKKGINTDFLQTGVSVDLIGDKKGEVDKVNVDIEILGFPVKVEYYPKEKWPANIRMHSSGLLAYRKDKMLSTYGSQTYDIEFYAEVHSLREKRLGNAQQVSVLNGRGGSVTWDEARDTNIRHDLEVKYVGGDKYKIMVMNKD